MHEHVAPAVYYLEVHLLFASVVCLAAWALTSAWEAGATAKYWIWVATSLNFMVPLAGFCNGFGASHVSWATQLGALAGIGIGISRNVTAGALLLSVWLCGAAFMLVRLLACLRRDCRDGHAPGSATPLKLAQGVPVTTSATGQGPSVDGVLRPHISLPAGIDRLLTEGELEAVLIHEVTHARRRDNLVGLIHEIALCALWFHPLVWLTSSRLALFRELSCDDSVIERSRGPDLISALAKLADPGESRLLSAGAATLFRHRVARLTGSEPRGAAGGAADVALIVAYAIVLLACVVGTIAHTPSCFRVAI